MWVLGGGCGFLFNYFLEVRHLLMVHSLTRNNIMYVMNAIQLLMCTTTIYYALYNTY